MIELDEIREAENFELWPDLPAEPISEQNDVRLILDSFLSGEDRTNFLLNHLEPPNVTFGNPEKDGEDFHIFLPFSDINGWVYEKEILSKARRALKLGRLEGVRSLSNVAYTHTSVEGRSERVGFAKLTSTREKHELVAARTMEAIMRNNNFSEEEIYIGVSVLLLHDRETPAMGDATKSVDPDALNEEDHWRENLAPESLEFLASIEAATNVIDDAIHNRGPLGELLDIADKIAYVMVDIHQMGEEPLYPNLGNIYKDVVYDRDTGQVYFRDRKRLQFFLYERARLFNHVYIAPDSQASDFVFASLLAPYYSRTEQEGKVTPQKLRQMTDRELIQFLADKYGFDAGSFYASENWNPSYLVFDNLVDALKGAIMITGDPDKKVLGIKRRFGFNPATDFKVWDEDFKEVVPFSELMPVHARLFENWAKETTGYLVVYCDPNSDSLMSYITPSMWA